MSYFLKPKVEVIEAPQLETGFDEDFDISPEVSPKQLSPKAKNLLDGIMNKINSPPIHKEEEPEQ